MEKIIKNRFVQHVLFWLFFISVFRADFRHEFNLPVSMATKFVFVLSFAMYVIFVYLNLLIFLPRLFLKKRYLSYFAVNIAVTSVLIISVYIIIHSFAAAYHLNIKPLHWCLFNMFLSALLIILTTFLHFIRQWTMMNENNLKAQKEKISSELEALKAQINPHLLFNTLNNLYSLSLEKSDKLPGLILKLSELMNYVLYECKSDFVPLNNEIEFIKSYVELEKIRFEGSIEIQSAFETDNKSLKIAPLLLLPFVDNAFKHSHTIENKRKISIMLKMNETMMVLNVENTYDPVHSEQEERTGIGVSNVKKRLEYLYPGKHIIDICPEENVYKVKLVLDLK